MNKRAFLIGIIYSVLVIIFKLIILLGGFTLTKFGFYYSNIVTVFAIIPFFALAIYLVREKDFGGVISGKDAIRMAFTVLAVASVLLTIYHYAEFNWKYKDVAVTYYHSKEYKEVLENMQSKMPDKIKPEDFPKIIDEQIGALSAGKAATGKLFPLVLIGLGGAFMCAIFMKRSVSKTQLN